MPAPAKHFTAAQSTMLAQLRARFLQGTAGAADYWRTEEELSLYDATFGERIGWKWDAVLAELSARGWAPRSRAVVDWGCGPGIASRRVLGHWPGAFANLTLHDRSARAMSFAERGIRAEFAAVPVRAASALTALEPGTLLLLSHVLNELSPAQLGVLVELAGQAEEVIWVEAGTHAESRRLVEAVREPLLASGRFHAVAPCTHSAACGLRAPANERHWCHSFGHPPTRVFQSPQWSEWSRTQGVDLRSLPYSFLVLARTPESTRPVAEQGSARMLGHPREYKGFSKVLSCEAAGVGELMLQKRDDPALYKEVTTEPHPPLFKWQHAGERIQCGARVAAPSADTV